MRTCIDCQFLVKTALLGRGTQGGFAFRNSQWDDEELKTKEISRELGDRVECFRGVWNESSGPGLDVKARVEENRNKCKFFMPLDKTRLATSAVELWQIQRQNRQHRTTIMTIILAAVIGGVVGGLISY